MSEEKGEATTVKVLDPLASWSLCILGDVSIHNSVTTASITSKPFSLFFSAVLEVHESGMSVVIPPALHPRWGGKAVEFVVSCADSDRLW